MSCESYNLLKEGNVTNIYESNTVVLTGTQLYGLYDGDYTTPAVTLSGTGQSKISLLIEFGEAFDICHVDYYTTELLPSRLQLGYGTISGTETIVPFINVSPNLYRATLNSFARLIEFRHTVSGTIASAAELEIIGTKNETLGFGSGITNQLSGAYITNSPIGRQSSSPQSVSIYNSGGSQQTARIAVAPTLTEADNYVFVGTSPNGEFYGISDYGFHLPGPNPITLHDDQFFSYEIDSQWERVMSSGPHKITPTPEGLYFDIGRGRITVETESEQTAGILSRDFFSAESFTADLEVRLLRQDDLGFGPWNFGRDIFLILTNNYPIHDVGYHKAFPSQNRRGGISAGISLRVVGQNEVVDYDNFKYHFRAIDGTASDNLLDGSVEDRWTAGLGDDLFLDDADQGGKIYESEGPNLAEMEDAINESVSFGDFTESANWHRWKLVYDARLKKLSAYVNNINIGSYIFRVEQPSEGCKLFFGIQGNGGIKVQIRNFVFRRGEIYRQKNVASIRLGSTPSATISGSEIHKAVDGDISTVYVGPSPTSNAKIKVTFDGQYDIAYYTLRQRHYSNPISAYGTTYHADTARIALADFGGKGTYLHRFPSAVSYNNESELIPVPRAPTFSGTQTTISGVNYVELQLTNYDRTSQANGALCVSEFAVYAHDRIIDTTLPSGVADNRHFPWITGFWNNLRQYGATRSISLKDKVSPEAAFVPFPEYVREGIDFDFSSKAITRQGADTESEYEHAETLFSQLSTDQFGAWSSAVQQSGDIWVWRAFEEHSWVKSVYWDSDVRDPSNVADSFKIQYLRVGGSPHNESDWVNVPVIAITHPYTNTADDAAYKIYRDFLIANNDGVWYNNYYNRPSTTTFAIGNSTSPRGIVVPPLYGYLFTLATVSSSPTVNGLTGYVEFDTAVFTKAIRLVVRNSLSSGLINGIPGIFNPGEIKKQFALSDLFIFRTNGTGSIVSPVIDTGSRQNTERLFVDVVVPPGTSSRIFSRSSDTAPSVALDTLYEVWEDLGEFGTTDVPFLGSSVSDHTRIVTREGQAYYLTGGGNAGKETPLIYDFALDLLSEMPDYPGGGDSLSGGFFGDSIGEEQRPAVLPDDRIVNNAVIIDDVLYLAVYTSGDTRNPRLAKFVFNGDITGWQLIRDYRPGQTVFGSMVAFDRRLYFITRDGLIIYYDIDFNIWFQSDQQMPLYGSVTFRDRVQAVSWEGKIYLFGGRIFSGGSQGLPNVDVYDPIKDEISIGVSAPYPITAHQAILVPEERIVYFLPQYTLEVFAYLFPTMKYYFDTQTWEIVQTMSLSRGVVHDSEVYFSKNLFYYYYQGYIYAHDPNLSWSRSLVVKPTWSNGKLVHYKDQLWGSIPWDQADKQGELMPQDRYVQFRVELSSDDRVNSPVLERISVVVPQEITVPASGTANVWLKVGVSSEGLYQAWYSGEKLTGSFVTPVPAQSYSILYTQSEDGLSWGYPTTVSGTIGLSNDNNIAVRSPWVIKNSVSDYQMWFAKETNSTASVGSVAADIYYATFNQAGIGISAATQSLPHTAASFMANGVYHPTVIKESSSSYKIWFTAKDASDVQRIGYATSTNGIVWTGHQVVISIGEDTVNLYDTVAVYKPCVLYENGSYRIYYTADDGDVTRLFHRTSINGTSWGPIQVILDAGSEGELDVDGCSYPMVINDAGTYYLYYFGLQEGVKFLIRASSPDGILWSEFKSAMPPYGQHGLLDADGVIDFFVLVDRNPIIPKTMITQAKLKMYDA